MRPHGTNASVGRRARLRAMGLLAGLAVVAAACSGGSASPGVANLGSTANQADAGTAPPANSGSAAAYSDAVSYASCMRSHGVPNMPDPNKQGEFLTDRGVLNGVRIDQNTRTFSRADTACSHLLPNGGKMTPAQQQQAVAKALKFVHCLRTHGIPNMADPVTSGGNLGIQPPAGDGPGTPQWTAATNACRAYKLGP